MADVPLRGDEGELFACWSASLLRVISSRVSAPRTLIEDACGFAWLQLVRCQPERGERLFGWLFTVAYREALRLLEIDRRTDHIDQLDPLEPTNRAELHRSALDALECLASLPQRQRDLLAGKIAGLSYEELATREGSSLRAVNRHLTRARATVREYQHQTERDAAP